MIGLPGRDGGGDQRDARLRDGPLRPLTARGPRCSSRRPCRARAAGARSVRCRSSTTGAPASRRRRRRRAGGRRRDARSRFKRTFDALDARRRGPAQGHDERHLRVQQPLHLLRGRHAHAGSTAASARASARSSTAYRAEGVTCRRLRRRRADAEPGARRRSSATRAASATSASTSRRTGASASTRTSRGRLVRSGSRRCSSACTGPTRATHAQQVGVAEAFEQTVGGIRNAVRHAPAGVELGMNTTLTKGNCRSARRHRGPRALARSRRGALAHLAPFGTTTASLAPWAST